MSKSLGTLTIDLVAKTGGFVQGMSKAERESAKWKKQVKKDLGEVADFAKKGLAVAAASAVAGGVALTQLVTSTAAASREMKTLAGLAGMSAEEFQAAAHGASLYGVQQEKFADILKDTQDKIGDFVQTGGGAMADFFENIAPKVGVTAEQFRKLSGKDALQLYISSLEKANLSQSDMIFYMEAIASDSSKLIPLFSENGRLLNQFAQEARDAGLVLNDVDLAALEGAQRTVDQISAAWRGAKNVMAIEVAPVLEGIAKHFLNIAKESGGVRSVAAETANGVANSFGFAADAVEGLRRTVLVAGSTIAIFGLGAKDVMLTVAKAVIDFPTQAVNGLITMLNTLPGIDIGGFGQGELSKKVEAEIQEARKAIDIGWSDVHDILMEPMPSESIKQFVAESREAAKAVAGDVKQMNTEFEKAGEKGFWQKWLEGAREALTTFDQLSKTVVDNFTSGFGNAFESVIIDSTSAEDAFKKMTEGMLRSIVNAIGQMIAQWIAYQTVHAITGRATQASAATSMSANAAAMSIQAGLNAFAATAAIPIIGPAAAPAAMATAIGVTAPMAAAVSSLALSGMAHDGIDSVPEDGTWFLQKGERVVTSETSAKLDAKLDKAGDMVSQGKGVSINIIEDASKAGTQESINIGEEEIINIFVSNISRGGKADKAIRSSYGLSRYGK